MEFPLTDPKRWRKKRADYMDGARGCKATLTNPSGFWRLEANDAEVIKAVGYWVDKARDAHAFALGRKAVIDDFIVIGNGYGVRGPLFVGAV